MSSIRAVLLLLLLGLSACSGGLPLAVDDAVLRHEPVDQMAAQKLINEYRAAHGLPPLALSNALRLAAQDMADHIARRDRMKSPQHSAAGLLGRLKARGIAHDAAAENLGYGYPTLAKAFAGWRGSSGHDRNLLDPNVSEMGLALTTRSDGKWRNFWALIMARPET